MSQKGFAHLLLILVLLAGIVVGVYLITSGNPLKLFSKAFGEPSVDQLTNQLVTLNSGRGAQDTGRVGQMISVAQRRQALLLEEIEKDPQAFLTQARLTSQRGNFPPEVQQFIEEEKEVIGSMMVVHEDNFEAKKGRYIYSVQKDNNQLEILHFIEEPTNLVTGIPVSVKGVSLKSQMALAGSQDLTISTRGRGAQALNPVPPRGNQKTAVLRVHFGSEAPPLSMGELRSLLFGSTNSLRSYYEENSFSLMSFTGEIIDVTISGTHQSCDWFQDDGVLGDDRWDWTVLAEQAARAQGFPLESYPRVIYIFPTINSCEREGMGSIGGTPIFNYPSLTWLPSRTWVWGKHHLLGIYLHEMGHNLTLDHANVLLCGSESIASYDRCQDLEYGDPWSIMGFDIFDNAKLFHLNGASKALLGWISPVRAVSTSGIYTLNGPIEEFKSGSESGNQAIRIAKADTKEYYYLSFRQQIGWDANIPQPLTEGASIHIFNEGIPVWLGAEYTKAKTKLIDTTPGSPGNLHDAALSDGWHFYDPINKILIRQLKHDAKSVTVEVKFNVAEAPPQPTPRPSPTPTPQLYIYRLINDRSGIISKYLCSLDPTQPMGARLSINSCQQIGLPYRNLGLQYTSEYVARSEGQDYLMRLIYYSDGRYQERRCLLGANTLTTKDLDSCELHRELNIGTNLQYTSEYIAPYSGKNYLFRLIYNKDGSYEERRCRLDENNPMGVSFNDCEQVRSLNIGQGLQYTSEYVAKYEGQDYLFRLVYNKNGDYTEYRCPLDSENPMGAKIQNVATQCTKIRSLNIGTNLQHTSEFVAP